MVHNRTPYLSLLCVVFMTGLSFSQDSDSTVFAVPDILKDNVAFWKKIYTEVGLKEGILHDKDYPLVIFKKLQLDQMSTWSSNRYIEAEKSRVAKCLKNVQTQPESTWTDEEKAFVLLYKEKAPEGALARSETRVRFQLGQKERFRQGLERSTAYLDTIRTIFASYHIPQRLAYLPHVESSFNFESYSRVGAAGVWQFMRGTGRLFLRINYLIDERRDPILSTVAAAKLLNNNYQQLGAWPLAITAYNHGVNGMKRAVETTGSRDIAVIIQNYSSPTFQFASKNFFACFLAASDIAMHATDYFNDLHCARKVEFKNVRLPSYMKPAVICKYLNVPQDVLREFNPALRPVVFGQQKLLPAQYEIRVPRDIASGSMEKALAAIPDSLKSSEPERSDYYSVRYGDNLYTIAQRLGVSVSQLAMENNINRKNRIFEGQVLRVPQTGKIVEVASASPIPADSSQNLEAQETAEKPPETTVVAPAPTSRPATVSSEPTPAPPTVQTAKSGKKPEHNAPHIVPSLPPLAVKMLEREKLPTPAPPVPETPPAAVGPITDSLKEIVFAAADTVPRVSSSGKSNGLSKFDVDVYNLEVTLSPTGNTAQILVSVDETMGHYAEWLGIPTWRLRQLNRMGGRSEIRINRPLLVPADQPMLDKMVKARLEYHLAIEEDFYGRFKVTDVKQKIIRRGENLWDICNGQEPIPLWLFKKYNKQLDLGTLMPGSTVWIPVVEEKTEQELRAESAAPGGIYQAFPAPQEAARAKCQQIAP